MYLHRKKFALRNSTTEVTQIYRPKCVSRIIQNANFAFHSRNVNYEAVDPPDNRRFYLWNVDQLVGRAVFDIEGIPCSIYERTVVTCSKAYCCLSNMKSNAGCSNNRQEFLDTWNPASHCQGPSDRICCRQIFPDKCIREPQHPHHSIPSEPDE